MPELLISSQNNSYTTQSTLFYVIRKVVCEHFLYGCDRTADMWLQWIETCKIRKEFESGSSSTFTTSVGDCNRGIKSVGHKAGARSRPDDVYHFYH